VRASRKAFFLSSVNVDNRPLKGEGFLGLCAHSSAVFGPALVPQGALGAAMCYWAAHLSAVAGAPAAPAVPSSLRFSAFFGLGTVPSPATSATSSAMSRARIMAGGSSGEPGTQ
jgi:hypothetical protein